jgi:hypothetical protein
MYLRISTHGAFLETLGHYPVPGPAAEHAALEANHQGKRVASPQLADMYCTVGVCR